MPATGRGSLVLVAEEGADLRELEFHPGARVCDLGSVHAPASERWMAVHPPGATR